MRRTAAWYALGAHAALTAMAVIALVVIVPAGAPRLLDPRLYATVYRAGWMVVGPLCTMLGGLAALLHAASRIGWRRALALGAVASGIALVSELVGTTTGVPFGHYAYTSLLGYRIAGRVPFPIPVSWFYMVYCALALCGRFLPARADRRTRLVWALVAAAILTAWDTALDPAMSSATNHWVWQTPGIYYGMPLTNWIGWYVTGAVIAAALLRVVPPATLAARVSPSPLPSILYAVNGVLPIAVCARYQLWGPALIGLVTMAVPVVLAGRIPPVCASSSLAPDLAV